jgi:hypothetical protein
MFIYFSLHMKIAMSSTCLRYLSHLDHNQLTTTITPGQGIEQLPWQQEEQA